jgi:cytidylate kinase
VGAGRLLSRCASVAVAWGTPPGLTADELLPDEPRRRELEREVRTFAQPGRGVILGRAAVLLRSDPRALHVRLDGPAPARVTQATAIEGIDREAAERRLRHTDRFRRAYLETLYGIDPTAPGVFHLTLDSTAITLADCVEIIADAAQRRARARPQ